MAVDLAVKRLTKKEAAHVSCNRSNTEDSGLSKLFFIEIAKDSAPTNVIQSSDDHPLIRYM